MCQRLPGASAGGELSVPGATEGSQQRSHTSGLWGARGRQEVGTQAYVGSVLMIQRTYFLVV